MYIKFHKFVELSLPKEEECADSSIKSHRRKWKSLVAHSESAK